jgi:hypothetical protein
MGKSEVTTRCSGEASRLNSIWLIDHSFDESRARDDESLVWVDATRAHATGIGRSIEDKLLLGTDHDNKKCEEVENMLNNTHFETNHRR